LSPAWACAQEHAIARISATPPEPRGGPDFCHKFSGPPFLVRPSLNGEVSHVVQEVLTCHHAMLHPPPQPHAVASVPAAPAPALTWTGTGTHSLLYRQSLPPMAILCSLGRTRCLVLSRPRKHAEQAGASSVSVRCPLASAATHRRRTGQSCASPRGHG
jgi:hypothetical protein